MKKSKIESMNLFFNSAKRSNRGKAKIPEAIENIDSIQNRMHKNRYLILEFWEK